MGKPLTDLALSDTPLPSGPSGPDVDPRTTVWYRFSEDIEDLLATGKYTWALTTLRGIQGTVERTHRVSDAQRRAVENIEAAQTQKERGGYRSGSRRYEGFGGRAKEDY